MAAQHTTFGTMAWAFVWGLIHIPTAGWAQAPPPRPTWPGLSANGKVQLPNGWKLQPAGRQIPLGDFPIALAESPKDPVLAVLHAGYGDHEVVTIDLRTQRVVARVALAETFGGLVWSPDGTRLYVGGGFDDVVYRFDHKDGLLANRVILVVEGAADGGNDVRDEPLTRPDRGAKRALGSIAGLALSADGNTLWAANAFAHRLERFDTQAAKLQGEIDLETDSYPYALVLDEPRGRAYVSLWGRSAIAVIDLETNAVVATWPTGPHPNEVLPSPDGKRLYVANANRNTVTVHDLEADGKALATIGTAIDPRAPAGCTPNALALSPDGAVLFVANANTNDVAVVNVTDPAQSTPLGFIPTGWYPTCVRVARDGNTLWIANGKGLSSSANREGPNPLAGRADSRLRQYIGGLYKGTLSIVRMPTPRVLAGYAKTVYECSPVNRADPRAVTATDGIAASPIPRTLGEPSPIKYCLYIIKENRTYDQVFGDIAGGNGDPSICLFPESVTPNQHALAREFVLLDNFYVEGEVSADGHEWTVGAYASDFVERTWPLSYRGDKRAPYPSDGNFPISKGDGGYLWDRAHEKGLSYRTFGEFVSDGDSKDPGLKGHVAPKFPPYDLEITDQFRADRFLEELAEFEQKGEMPRLMIMHLPNDHTAGTRPGSPTPTAMVADNDLALGRIVEALSRSRFWPELAIFVVEDDAQNGSDHVDAHRSIAQVISPYSRRRSIDSTLYSTSSMLRTIELILGLEPMSQFDASATPMFASFTATPDLAPFQARPARVDLKAVNDPDAPGAAASLELDLSKEDRADDLAFNAIIWKSVKGADSVMPPPVRAAFVLPHARVGAVDDDD